MSTTGSPWDGDVRRPRRVRIRRPDDRGAGAWRGPDSPRHPAPRPAASYPAEPEYAGGNPYAPETAYPDGPEYLPEPAPFVPEPAHPSEADSLVPYAPPAPYPYEPGSAYPYEPGSAYPDGPPAVDPDGPPVVYPYEPPPAYSPAYPSGPGAAGPAGPRRAYPYEPDGSYPYAPGPYAPDQGARPAPCGEAPYPPARRGPAVPAPGYPYALDAAPSSSPAAYPSAYPPAPRNDRAPARAAGPAAGDARGGLDGDAPRYRDAPGSTDGGYGPDGYQQVQADHGQDPPRYGREAADYGGTAAAPDGHANVPARPGVPGTADPPESAYGPGGAYVPGRAYGAGGAYAPGGPGYEFGYQPVPEPVEPYSAGPATAPRADFTTRPRPDYDRDFGADAFAADETIVAGRAGHAPVAPDEAAPGYEFGYVPDASPPEQDDLLALPPGGEPGRRAGDGAARSAAGYTYAPTTAPPPGPPGSGPPGFEFPGSGRPRPPRAGQPPRRPVLALPPGAGHDAGNHAGDRPGTGLPDGDGPRDGVRDGAWTGGRAGEQERYEPVGARRGWLRDLVFPRPAAGGTAEHGPALPPPLSAAGIKRWAVRVALPMISMVAVGIAVVATFGGGSGGAGPAPATLSVGFPPATAAGALFSTTPGDEERGISQSLARVASSGSQVVAVGSQAGARISRAQFFVSANGGQTWRLGTEQATDGGDPAPGHAATLIAGGQGRWVAVGPSAIWTSHDGVAWTLASTQGITPMQGGDQANVLRRTATGFLAAGENVPPGDPAAATPVVWTSANGVTWRRLGAAQLHLTAEGGRAGALTSAAADGAATVISGVVTMNGARGGGARSASGVWRSTNGGATWSAATVPVSSRATASAAVAATANGFVAVRPGQAKTGADAVVFTSPDGAAWKFGATVTGQGGAGLTLTSVEGGPAGAVITGRSGANVLAFTSTDGAVWRPDGILASATAGTISGLAVIAGGAIVAAGSSAAGPLGQQPMLTVDNAGRLTAVSFAGIPGAVQPEVAVSGIAADGSNQVAVGSANGFPATWFSANAGTSWVRGTGAPASALNRPGLQELSGVVHGAAGWVAAGGVQSAAAQHPVVVTSADGQTWQAPDTARAFAGAGVFTVGVAAGKGGYVVVGRQAVAGQDAGQDAGRTVAAAWWSAGLTGWQRGTDAAPGALDGPGTSRQMLAAAADADGFVAVGSAGTRPGAWISPNGRTWRAVTLARPTNSVRAQLQEVTINGRRIVAVGMSATSGGQTAPFTALSVDGGATWTESPLPSPGAATAVNAVAPSGSGFTATGTFGADGHQDVVIWTATDGLNWKTNSPSVTGLGGQGVQEITALAVSGSTLTGVGFAASPTSETPTIWRSPIRS